MNKKLCFALDVPSKEEVKVLLDQLYPVVKFFKIGLELFIAEGPSIVDFVKSYGDDIEIFLDLKIHDIPETVYKAVQRAKGVGAGYLTVHCSAGLEGLIGASGGCSGGSLKLLGVTVLTSMSNDDCLGVYGYWRERQVEEMVKMAMDGSLDGVICSALDLPIISQLEKQKNKRLIKVTPGIRLEGTQHHDQKSVETPEYALENNSDILVVGRPIRLHSNPSMAAKKFIEIIERFNK